MSMIPLALGSLCGGAHESGDCGAWSLSVLDIPTVWDRHTRSAARTESCASGATTLGQDPNAAEIGRRYGDAFGGTEVNYLVDLSRITTQGYASAPGR